MLWSGMEDIVNDGIVYTMTSQIHNFKLLSQVTETKQSPILLLREPSRVYPLKSCQCPQGSINRLLSGGLFHPLWTMQCRIRKAICREYSTSIKHIMQTSTWSFSGHRFMLLTGPAALSEVERMPPSGGLES